MNRIACPVCREEHPDGEPCPRCGYEVRLLLNPADEELQQLEAARLARAQEVWAGICQRLEQQAATKPLAFLVTPQQTVYCLYEGLNTFGSAKQNANCQQHQKVIAGECRLRPVHFAIEATPAERRYQFTLSETTADGAAAAHSVFVNNESVAAGSGTPIGDNDNIVVQSEQGQATIKFRINLN